MKTPTAAVLLLAVAAMGCGTISAFREGEMDRRTLLCPIISEGIEVAALAVLGPDQSLWHIIERATSAELGCTDRTERLLVEPGLINLDNNGRPKVLPLDLAMLKIIDPSKVSRAERRGFTAIPPDESLMRVVRFNKRNLP